MLVLTKNIDIIIELFLIISTITKESIWITIKYFNNCIRNLILLIIYIKPEILNSVG